MPCIRYKVIHMRKQAREIVNQANELLKEYAAQGYTLTLRQLYYRFVGLDLLPKDWANERGEVNNMKSYKNFGNIINNARLTGYLDWEAIVDLTRFLREEANWASPRAFLDNVVPQYHEDLWAGQNWRVEVWAEKDALVPTIGGLCKELDVPLLSCRGYTSQSEMWGSAMRLRGHTDAGYRVQIIHLGDHDPSGIDMSRDIQDRLEMFGAEVEFNRILLNKDQINRYKPPPNPAKVTDSRAKGYIRLHGRKSWELDALEPSVIVDLLRRAVLRKRDDSTWNRSVRAETKNRKKLESLAKKLK